jgi:hypothetical protein
MGVGLGLAVEEADNTGKADESTSDDLLKGIVPPVASNVGVVRGEVGGDGAGLGGDSQGKCLWPPLAHDSLPCSPRFHALGPSPLAPPASAG